MKQVMFDIDGTLIQSSGFDDACYEASIKEVTGINIKSNWSTYPHVTDSGILKTFIERQAPQLEFKTLEAQVKAVFIRKIAEHLQHSPAVEVEGAIDFLERLNADKDISVSIATGGWRETAMLKLKSAGFDTGGLVLSSSSDHYSRIEIMKHAADSVSNTQEYSFTYFGDAEWDVRACLELNVNLVVIGDKVKHSQSLPNFKNYKKAIGFVSGYKP
ncbi:HAD family hydrolase [Hellea sp.]|nr:HAD family hydrolase [Hellea sp.]